MNYSDTQDKDIFSLSLDEMGKAQLLETARWTKFLAILGFIFLGLVFLVMIFAGSIFSNMLAYSGSEISSAIFIVYAIVIVGLYFYPTYALLKFSNHIKPAIHSSSQADLNLALTYLKRMFKYIGILMIIVLAFYLLAILFGGIAAALR